MKGKLIKDFELFLIFHLVLHFVLKIKELVPLNRKNGFTFDFLVQWNCVIDWRLFLFSNNFDKSFLFAHLVVLFLIFGENTYFFQNLETFKRFSGGRGRGYFCLWKTKFPQLVFHLLELKFGKMTRFKLKN